MKDQNIKDLLAKTSGKAKGSTLPEDMRLYRYELVEALLKAGIPLLKARYSGGLHMLLLSQIGLLQ